MNVSQSTQGASGSNRSVRSWFSRAIPPALALAAMLVLSPGSARAQWGRAANALAAQKPPVFTTYAQEAPATAIAAGDPGCPTERHVKNIVGSWLITTNGPDSFKALATFISDGNVIFVTQGEASGAPLFTSEHGVWGCIGDHFTMTWLEINYNPDGSFAGIFKVRGNITLNAAGDGIDVRFVFEFKDAGGMVVATGGGTGSGKRIKLEPLP